MGNVSLKTNQLLQPDSLVDEINKSGVSVEVFNSFEAPAFIQHE